MWIQQTLWLASQKYNYGLGFATQLSSTRIANFLEYSRKQSIYGSYGKSTFFDFFWCTYIAWFGQGRNSMDTRSSSSSGTQRIGPVFLTGQLMTRFPMSSFSSNIWNVITQWQHFECHHFLLTQEVVGLKPGKNIWSVSGDILNVVIIWQHLKCSHLITTYLEALPLSNWFGLSQCCASFNLVGEPRK